MTGLDETGASPFATSSAVTTIFDNILAAVHDGSLQPGQRISDAALAGQLGVSRTPVREALLRLREIGVIEASPNRFTRVAAVTPHQTAQAMIVWVALYDAVIAEVVPVAAGSTGRAMRRDHAAFLTAVENENLPAAAMANLSFFDHLVRASTNLTLHRAVTSVVHIVRLGSMHLPDRIDLVALANAQQLLLDAVEAHDLTVARRAIAMVGVIQVPQE